MGTRDVMEGRPQTHPQGLLRNRCRAQLAAGLDWVSPTLNKSIRNTDSEWIPSSCCSWNLTAKSPRTPRNGGRQLTPTPGGGHLLGGRHVGEEEVGEVEVLVVRVVGHGGGEVGGSSGSVPLGGVRPLWWGWLGEGGWCCLRRWEGGLAPTNLSEGATARVHLGRFFAQFSVL